MALRISTSKGWYEIAVEAGELLAQFSISIYINAYLAFISRGGSGDGVFVPPLSFVSGRPPLRTHPEKLTASQTPQTLLRPPRSSHPLPLPVSLAPHSTVNHHDILREQFDSDQHEREKVFETSQLARLSQHVRSEGQRAHDFEFDCLAWTATFARVRYDHERKFVKMLGDQQCRLNEALRLSNEDREEQLRRARQTMDDTVANERAKFQNRLNELVAALKARSEEARRWIREEGRSKAEQKCEWHQSF